MGLIGGGYFPHRVFPQGKNIVSVKIKEFQVFLFEKPPLAVLLNSVGCGYKAIT
jgi:hypothetical protein